MTNGKRDYSKEKSWEKSHKNGQRLKDRAKRNAARRIMEKAGKVRKNDGKHVDHLTALLSGGSNNRSNLRVTSAKSNLTKEAKRKQRASK